MEIGPADASDIPELTHVEIESKRASLPELVSAIETDPALRQHRWNTYFRGESPAGSKRERHVLKAKMADRIVGYIAGHLTPRYEMDGEIQSFYVLREQQRKGIGFGLLSAACTWFHTAGARRLCVGIAAENPYRVFYLKHGAHCLNEHWMFWDDIRPLVPALPESVASSVSANAPAPAAN